MAKAKIVKKDNIKDMELWVSMLKDSYNNIKKYFLNNHKCGIGDEVCAECEEWFINDMSIDRIADNAMIKITE